MIRRNALLAQEASLERILRESLFETAGLGHEALARMQVVVALIESEQAILTSGDHSWMHSTGPGLGADHDQLLAQVRKLGLLGPELASKWEAIARADAARLQRSLQALTDTADAGLAWDAHAGQFVLSAHCQALLAGLAALIDQPFMAKPMNAEADSALTASQSTSPLKQLVALGWQRRHFMNEGVPLFPPDLRDAAGRFAQVRVARMAVSKARQFVFPEAALVTATLEASAGPAERLAMIDAGLREAGETELALWLVRTLGEEIPRCDLTLSQCPAPAAANPPAAWDSAGARAAPASGVD